MTEGDLPVCERCSPATISRVKQEREQGEIDEGRNQSSVLLPSSLFFILLETGWSMMREWRGDRML